MHSNRWRIFWTLPILAALAIPASAFAKEGSPAATKKPAAVQPQAKPGAPRPKAPAAAVKPKKPNPAAVQEENRKHAQKMAMLTGQAKMADAKKRPAIDKQIAQERERHARWMRDNNARAR
jgi:hypothetical protein